MTQKIILLFASMLGIGSVILGAFAAHALKKVLEPEQLSSFETGVKYQMYHALALLFVGIYFKMDSLLPKSIAWCFMIGVLFFSFSIYALVLSKKMSFLAPVTPIGGTLLIGGWGLMILYFWRNF